MTFGNPLAVSRTRLPDGDAGTDQTVDKMAKVAMGNFGAASVAIRGLALRIISDAGCAQKDQLCETRAIHCWVQDRLRYVRDPLGAELLTYPETLAFDLPHGDCDDHVILETALLAAIGIPSSFVVIALGGSPVFSHVYMCAYLNRPGPGTDPDGTIYLDPIKKDQPAGWEAPDWTMKRKYPISTPSGALYQPPQDYCRDAMGNAMPNQLAGFRSRQAARTAANLAGLGFLLKFLKGL